MGISLDADVGHMSFDGLRRPSKVFRVSFHVRSPTLQNVTAWS